MEKRGDVFLKEETIEDKASVKTQIEKITADTDKQEALLIGMNAFYDYMPNASKEIKMTGTRPKVSFETYGNSVDLNLKNKELVGFTPSGFDSYQELFKAASLTNYLKKVFKGKTSTKEKPFNISRPGQDIEFDASTWSIDKEAIDAGRNGTLGKICPTLNSEYNTQAYVDYLNSLKFWKIAK